MVIYVGLSHLVDGHHAHRLGVGGDRWVELDRALDPGAHLARASFGSARSCRRARRRVPSGAQMRQGASVHGRRRSRRPAATHVDLDPALEALDPDALRRFIRAHAATLDDELRAVLADALLEHAARHGAGYGPKTPAPRPCARRRASPRPHGGSDTRTRTPWTTTSAPPQPPSSRATMPLLVTSSRRCSARSPPPTSTSESRSWSTRCSA